MNNYQLVVQALDHIEAELKSPLSVTALSRRTGYSLYHFIRLFQAITGITPGDYIARRKITEAAKDLKRWPERSFQDIALDYHFNDYETFTRAFKGCCIPHRRRSAINEIILCFHCCTGFTNRTCFICL